MPFNPAKHTPEKPDFSKLKTTLANSRIATENNALYQTIFQLIDKIQKLKQLDTADFNEINAQIESIDNSITIINNNLASATFITELDETSDFPDSRQLIAGANITLDVSVAGEIEISASGGPDNGYWTLLTDGDVDETDFIFANGDAISVFVPLP